MIHDQEIKYTIKRSFLMANANAKELRYTLALIETIKGISDAAKSHNLTPEQSTALLAEFGFTLSTVEVGP